ncbi:MAG: hypothetical protein L3J54_12215 [Draconibacterium sp.]|nr:hypothetical protein [Draconibacterium sp.]
MSFNGTESKKVSLADASVWTSNYRRTISQGEIIAHFFGKEKLNDILSQSGCMGIRMYHGLDNGKKNLVLVGTDSDENDLVNGVILENAITCPTNCSSKNSLNS